MKFRDFYFGEFAPDIGGAPNSADPAYLVDCLNLRSTPQGYRGIPTFSAAPSAGSLAGGTVDILGNTFVALRDDTTYLFVSADMSGGNFINQSNNLGQTWNNVATITGKFIEFAQFDDYVIAVERGTAPKYKTITDSAATAFVNLPDSPPQGACIARVRDHIVIGNTATDPYSVQWCAIGDPADWPTPNTSEAQSKEAGSQRLPSELGTVTKIVGGEKFGLVFQQRGITRMTYVGGNVMYEFDSYEKRIGAFRNEYAGSPAPAVFRIGGLFYWLNGLHGGGFVTDGFSVNRFTEGLIEESFVIGSTGHPDTITTYVANTIGYDPPRDLIVFQGSTGSAQVILGYHPTSRRFVTLQDNIGRMFDQPAQTVSLFELHQIYTDGQLQRFGGAVDEIGLQTGFIEIEPGRYVQLHGAHLLGDNVSSLTLSYKPADDYGADISIAQSGFTNLSAPNRGIMLSGRSSAPLFAFQVTGQGFESMLIRGIRVYYEPGEAVQ